MNGKSTIENEVYTFLSTTLGNQDIHEKCKQLSLYVNSYESQFLHSIFPRVLEDIFSITQHSSWGLTVFHPKSHEFACVREFLGPKGSIFRMIEKIQEDEFLPKFSLPNMLVPLHMKAKVEAEAANGIQMKTKSAFELYFCYFSSYITKTLQNKATDTSYINHSYRSFSATSMPVAPEEYLYFSLLNDYLFHFMSTDSLPPTMSSGHNTNAYKYTKSHYSVTKASFLLRHDSGKDCSYGPSNSKEMRCCDVLMQLFCMFWLDDFQFVYPAKIVPTENHVRALRQLIKHVHTFCNAHSDHSLLKRFQTDLATEQLNQNMLLRLQPALSDFFCHCFEVWPLDCNFRIVLETWLSFIQPWRYNSTGDVRLNEDRNVANMWYHFICTNLSFYNKLFQLAVTRFIRVDMSSPENAMLLYRITKIYRQPNLVILIEEAEEAISGNTKNLPCHISGGNYESYLGSSHHDSMLKQVEDDFIFTDKFRDAINQLLLVSAQALNTIKSTKDFTSSDFSKKFLHYVGYGALFEQDGQENLAQVKSKMEEYLTYSIKNLADIFDLPIPDANSQTKWNKKGKDIADFKITENGKKVLSPLGRHQLQNNLRKFPVKPHTEYDLQPVRSFENIFLVRLLYTLSSKFNARFATKINRRCNEGDFVGRILKIIFRDKNETFSDQTRMDCKYRLSLRFLAHYRNVFYLVFLYIFSIVFGLNFFGVIFGLLLCGLLYIFIRALLIK